jgi:hypothetical protein
LEFTEKEQPLLDPKPQKIPEHRPVSPAAPHLEKSKGTAKSAKSTSKVRSKIFSLGFRSKMSALRAESHTIKTAVSDSSPSPSLALPTKRKVGFSGFDSPGHDDQQGDDLRQVFISHSHQQKWDQELNCGLALYKLSQGLNIMERRCATREKKTLGNLLDSGHLKRPECCLIALVLASSVYQLHSSPWLQNFWDNRKMVFFSSFTASGLGCWVRNFRAGFPHGATQQLPT